MTQSNLYAKLADGDGGVGGRGSPMIGWRGLGEGGSESMIGLVLPFLLALVVSLAGTLTIERLAGRLGLVIEPREDRWHRKPVPVLGGIAIMLGVLLPSVFDPAIGGRLGYLLGASVAMGAVGLYDDVRPLPPQAKLVAQIVLAAVLVQAGFLLRPTPYVLVNVFLTLFWVVGVTNAFNLLDNMDGLAAGMAAIAAGFRLVLFLMDGDREAARLTGAFLGATIGFFIRNAPPAKIFMGDAGSLFIGFFLSGVCLAGTFPYSRGVAAVLVFPVLLLLIPILDTTFVTLTRLITGRPVSQGGRDHTSHRLVGLGISEPRALVLLSGISVLSGLLAILSHWYGLTYTVGLMALFLLGLILLGVYLSRVQVVRETGADPSGPIVRLVADFPFKRQVATVSIDLVLIVIAYYTAYLLRFEAGFEGERQTFLRTVGPVIVLELSSLAAFGAYRGLWRYTSVPDLLGLLRGATSGVAASVLYFVFTIRFGGLSRAVFVLDWLLLVLLLCGSRVSFRLLSELFRRPREDFRRVLLYGAGDGGELMLRELRNNTGLRRKPVGFLDDDRSKVGSRILEVPVLGDLEMAERLLAEHRIGEVIVASQKIPPERLRRLEAICAPRGVVLVRASVQIG